MTRHIIDSKARNDEAGSRFRRYVTFEQRTWPAKGIIVAKNTKHTRSPKGRLLAFVQIERRQGTLV